MARAANTVWTSGGGMQNDSRRLNRRWPAGCDPITRTRGGSTDLGRHSDTVGAGM
jgi:hypothetical protein